MEMNIEFELMTEERVESEESEYSDNGGMDDDTSSLSSKQALVIERATGNGNGGSSSNGGGGVGKRWSRYEDSLLKRLVGQYGDQWEIIAPHFRERTEQQVQQVSYCFLLCKINTISFPSNSAGQKF